MELTPIQKRAKRALERLVTESGGVYGAEQIRVDELGLLQALYSERFIAAGDLHPNGRIVRTDGARGLDELVPLSDPARWDSLSAEIYDALEHQGWTRTASTRLVEYIIPNEIVDSPSLTITILTWNPDVFGGDDWLTDQIREFKGGWVVKHSWSTGRHRDGLQPGDCAVLLRQKRERGIVAIGTITSEIHQASSWKPGAVAANVVTVEWNHIAEIGDRLPIETLLERIPDAKWNNLYQSGRQFTGDIADDIFLTCCEWWGLDDEEGPN